MVVIMKCDTLSEQQGKNGNISKWLLWNIKYYLPRQSA